MRAWVFSDLHVDTAPYQLPPTPDGVDVIIIAGDVADGHERSARWLRKHAVSRGLPVIYVAGNHDFYGHDLGHKYANMYRDFGVELLHPGRPTHDIGGARFIGSTLWTDYAIAGDVDAARAWARWSMPDFVSIDLGLRRIGTRDLLSIHRMQRLKLELELAIPFAGKTVVVTHHAPHPMSLRSPMFIDDSDASFASDLSAMIQQYAPSAWIHGHLHNASDYCVGATRIVCNPRGYVTFRSKSGAEATDNFFFDPTKIVEI